MEAEPTAAVQQQRRKHIKLSGCILYRPGAEIAIATIVFYYILPRTHRDEIDVGTANHGVMPSSYHRPVGKGSGNPTMRIWLYRRSYGKEQF